MKKSKKITFTQQQNKILSEIYRRLNYFHKGNLDERLMLLAYPLEVKCIENLDLIIPYNGIIVPRALNWYSLSNKGKKFFSNYVVPLHDVINKRLFEGSYIKKFDYSYLSLDE